jgi:hypothetical protein
MSSIAWLQLSIPFCLAYSSNNFSSPCVKQTGIVLFSQSVISVYTVLNNIIILSVYKNFYFKSGMYHYRLNLYYISMSRQTSILLYMILNFLPTIHVSCSFLNTNTDHLKRKRLTLGSHNFYSIKNFPIFNFPSLSDLIPYFILYR